jgi:tetratricopeptide (TPR) repeat protein
LLSALVHFFADGRWGSLVETAIEGQSLTAEDKLFTLMQAAKYLTATRGLEAAEARICYERAESLCHSLNRPRLLYVALVGQWRYSIMTGEMSAAMQMAERVYSLAQEQNDSALMMGACRALAVTLYYLGDFESARQYATRGIEIWRSGSVQSPVEEVTAPAVLCLCYEALCKWHLAQIASSQATIAESMSLARELNDTHALAFALYFAGWLAYFEGNPSGVERFASDLIELSTRQDFAFWLALGSVLRGWPRSASGKTAEGLSWIEDGIKDLRAIGSMLWMPYLLALKAETLFIADRPSEALETINEAEALAERFEHRYMFSQLHRLRCAFLATLGTEETQIKASFQEAIRIAREQKSVSLAKRAEATYAEYRRQIASGSGGCGFRLPL